jgi:hypothetical protein
MKGRARLRVFGNRVLKTIFGSTRDEVTGGWRKLDNEKFHNLYTSSNIISMIKSSRTRWMGYVTHRGEIRNVHRILVGKTECKMECKT